jgi:hypothetical protein
LAYSTLSVSAITTSHDSGSCSRALRRVVLQIPTGDGTNDIEIANEAWRRHRLRNDSFVQDIFGGQYKSKLVSTARVQARQHKLVECAMP